MALTYDGTNGLFTRLGTLVEMMDQVRTHQNNLKTLLADVQTTYSSADAWMIDALSAGIEPRIQEAGGILSDIRAAAEKTIVEMCWTEAMASPSSSTNVMRTKTIDDALVWLIREMDKDSETVNGTTVNKTSASYGASNTGNGVFVYNTEAPDTLLKSTNDYPNIRSEIVEARCIQDAQSGGITRGGELFELRGQPMYSGLDYRFPGGSGKTIRVNCISAGIDAGPIGQNILTNGDLEDQTSNLPDQWSIVTGTAGTHFSTETGAGNFWRGAKSLKLIHGTGTLFDIRQQFGSATGTAARLRPDRPYVIAFAAKKDATATGNIRISIKNASGTIMDSGDFTSPSANFLFSYNVASFTTSMALYTLTLRTPRAMPRDMYIHLESTTTIATASVYIDEIVLAELIPIAPGGQAMGLVAGSTDWVIDDNGRFGFTNNNEGEFVRAFDRLFDMYHRGLSLPANYSSTETISDSLIT
jgi:hypothetical protein